MTIVRLGTSRDTAALHQENVSRIQQESLSRILEGLYRRSQEDLNPGAWVPWSTSTQTARTNWC